MSDDQTVELTIEVYKDEVEGLLTCLRDGRWNWTANQIVDQLPPKPIPFERGDVVGYFPRVVVLRLANGEWACSAIECSAVHSDVEVAADIRNGDASFFLRDGKPFEPLP